MKEHTEIKWSEVARKSIAERLMEMSSLSHTSEIRSCLDPKVRESIFKLSESKAKKLYKKMVKEEWKHALS